MAWYALIIDSRRGFRSTSTMDAGPPPRKITRVERIYGEFAAVERLGRAGVEAFAPVELFRARVGPRRARRWETCRRPLLSGYAFANVPAGLPLERIGAWREVLDVVRMGPDPYVIPEVQIAALRAVAEAMAASDSGPRDKARRRIRVGQRVEMAGAAWQGALGKVERVHREQVTVLIEFLGAQRPVKVAADEVEVVG